MDMEKGKHLKPNCEERNSYYIHLHHIHFLLPSEQEIHFIGIKYKYPNELVIWSGFENPFTFFSLHSKHIPLHGLNGTTVR